MLTSSEVNGLEGLVDSACDAFNSDPLPHRNLRNPLSVYRRQYVAIINDKGEKMVWINFFCSSFGDDWRRHVVVVFDGGACFFRLIINLSLRKVVDLKTNGIA